MLNPIKYQDLNIRGNIFAAPLAGYTNYPTRIILQKFGANLTFTEMVSADGLVYKDKKTISLLYTDNKEKSKAVQIFGDDKFIIKDAIEFIKNTTNYKIINLNMGCPVKKILKSKKGGYLLKDLKKVEQIFKIVSEIQNIIFTIKIRSGWDKNSINYRDIAKLAENYNIKMIIFHPRNVIQAFNGTADWDLVKDLKIHTKIPIIGNGDIFTPEQAKEKLDQSLADGIMIGRGFIGNPWIFNNIESYLLHHTYKLPSNKEKVKGMFQHLKLMIKYYNKEEYAVSKFRSQMFQYLKSFRYSAKIRNEIQKIESAKKIKKILINYKLI